MQLRLAGAQAAVGARLEAQLHAVEQLKCSICLDAVKKLESNGLTLEHVDKVRIVTNLLTVVCGEENAKPVISVSASS